MANTIKPSAGNPIKVLNSSLEGITVTDDGNVQVKLGDDAGSKKLSVRDSGDVEVAYIDSDGIISGASGSLPVPVEGNVLIGDSTPEWALLDASADTKILVGNGTTLASVALSGDVTMTNAGAVTIANDAVTLAKLANVTRGSLIVGGASDAPTLLSGKTLGAILIGDGTDIGSTVNPSIAGNVGIGGTLTVNTTNLVVNSTGVGIGVTPSTYFNIQFNSATIGKGILVENISTGNATASVLAKSPSNTVSLLSYSAGASAGLDNNGGVTSTSSLILMTDSSVASGGTSSIQFRVGGYFNTQERMRIDSSGNVGIGTSTPDTILDLVDSTDTIITLGSNSANYNAGIRLLENRGGTNSGGYIYYNGTDNRIDIATIKTDSTEPVRISIARDTGGVGINETTIPTGAKLAVGGGIAVTDGSGTTELKLDGNGAIIIPRATATISGDSIAATSTRMVIDTEASAASDDLDTITGGEDGQLLIISIADNSRVVTVTNTNIAGGVRLSGGTNKVLDNVNNNIVLYYDSTIGRWIEFGRTS